MAASDPADTVTAAGANGGRRAQVLNHANLIWSIAELLRGDYKQSEYGRVILPLVVMRRLDQVLEPTKDAVLAEAKRLEGMGVQNLEMGLRPASGLQFFNRSPLRFPQLLNQPGQIAINLRSYLDGYSSLARRVFENLGFDQQIDRLDRSDLLYPAIARICDVDLHPDRVKNPVMGDIFEELIRKFAEASNETAGEHFTPREIVQLMVDLLLDGDDEALTAAAPIRTVYDCACGTGGMLSEAQRHIEALNANAEVQLHGQELNPESYAICLADMLVKGQDASGIAHGNTLSDDQHAGQHFHYGIANPPFGVDWSKVERTVRDEHARGEDGRFGPGLPRKSDGALLFLLTLVAHMRPPEQGGGRVAIVHNGSPLFAGGAGSGESEIRRYLIENDLIEAIVGLPDQLFYNTGIATYVWVLTNRKAVERRGKVQLIDARDLWVKMRKSLGDKRRVISPEQRAEIVRLHGAFEEGDRVKLMRNEAFGYRTIVVDQSLRAHWEIGPNTFNGVEGDRPLAKLDRDTRDRILTMVRALPPQRFADEVDCATALSKGADGHEKPLLHGAPAAVLRALVERCLVRDPTDPVVMAPPRKGADPEPVMDPEARDTERVPLGEDVEKYLNREVRPHVEGARCTDRVGKIGYEIPFTRLFYRFVPPRPSEEIKSELRDVEQQIRRLLEEVLV